jgi:lysophospholipase L1-like esterase
MKVLFVGDSITKGTQGVNWISMIEKDHPYWTLVNAGRNGETLNKIAGRLKTTLEENDKYNAVVLQCGTNDILLPMFKHRGFWFRQAYLHQLRTGNIPSSPAEFEILLRKTVETTLGNYNPHVILTTLGCINEDLLDEANARLFSYNTIIKKIAREFNCVLADVSEEFQGILNRQKTHSYCLENFASTAFADQVKCSLGLADQLSKNRRLFLTIDGVHLNTNGAAIYKQQIEKAILLTKETSSLFI